MTAAPSAPAAGTPLEVAEDHPAFAGHFPGHPILPGAALLDETLEILRRERGIDPTRWQVASVKFSAAVRPGESLEVRHESPRDGLVRFTIHAAKRLVASGSLAREDADRTADPRAQGDGGQEHAATPAAEAGP